MEQPRITIADLPRGAYDHALHRQLADRGVRRYNPYSFDFDSTPLDLDDPLDCESAWGPDADRHGKPLKFL